jgi:hypothetical protein
MSCEAAESPARPAPTTMAYLLVDDWVCTFDIVDMSCLRSMDVVAMKTEKSMILKSLVRFMIWSCGSLVVYVVLYHTLNQKPCGYTYPYSSRTRSRNELMNQVMDASEFPSTPDSG